MKTKDSLIKIKNRLKLFNKQYYNASPTITDSEYDNLKREYDKLLSKNTKLKKFDDLGIGTTPSSKFEKFKHHESML